MKNKGIETKYIWLEDKIHHIRKQGLSRTFLGENGSLSSLSAHSLNPFIKMPWPKVPYKQEKN